MKASYSSSIALSAVVALVGWAPSGNASTTEEGGSGLSRIDYAWSLPLTDFIIGLGGSYYSQDFTPGSTRFLQLTPSVTKGLGAGFEGSAALPVDGLSQDLDDEEFDRRIDFKRRDLLTKLRWTGPLGSPRARFGLQGSLHLPLSGLRDIRPGGDEKPTNAFDPGVVGLFSTNVGWFDFPVRLHANVGYWWSRDDGAIYFQDHPAALSLIDEISNNDVASAGVAVEAGFRRFVLFGEVTTEHLIGARAQVRGKENLWRLAPGIRTDVGPDISLTASAAFDLSSNDSRTKFDPGDVYPDFELRVGVSFGNVLSRQSYENEKRTRDLAPRGWKLAAAPDTSAADETAAEPSETPEPVAVVKPIPVQPSPEPEPLVSRVVQAPAATPAPPEASLPPPSPTPQRAAPDMERELERRLEDRLARFELGVRVMLLESRVGQVERQPYTIASWPGLSSPASPAAPAVATAQTTDPGFGRLSTQIEDLKRQIVGQGQASPDVARSAAASESPGAANERVASAEPAPAQTSAPVETTPGEPTTDRADATQREIRELREAVASLQADGEGTRRATARAAARDELAALAEEIRMARAERQQPAATDGAAEATIRELRQQVADLRAARVVTAPTTGAPPVAVLPQSVIAPTAPPQTTIIQQPAADWSEFDDLVARLEEETATRPATASVSSPQPPTGERGSIDPFPMKVGDRRWLDELASGQSRDAWIAEWAADLARHPDVKLSVLVHGGGSDRAAALVATDEEAIAWRDRFVEAGVAMDRIVPLGMGISEYDPGAGSTRVEIERL